MLDSDDDLMGEAKAVHTRTDQKVFGGMMGARDGYLTTTT